MDWFGITIILIIIFVGWIVLKPKKSKRTYGQKWGRFGYNADRDNPAYEKWKDKVRAKSNGCVVCGIKYNLHCHHIIPFSVNRFKRYRVNNGCTLCGNCHSLYHSEYELSECNPKTLRAFIKKYKT